MIRFELDNVEIETPIGWDEIAMSLSRDEVYDGIDFKIDTDLTFLKTGFTLLNNYIEARDFDARPVLKIFVSDGEIYRGYVNLFEHTKTGKQISAPITQINFFEQIKSRETLEIDLYKETGIDGQGLTQNPDFIGKLFGFPAIPIFLRSQLTRGDTFGISLNVTSGLISQFVDITLYSILVPIMEVIESEIESTQRSGGSNMRAGISWIDSPNTDAFHIDTSFQNPPLPGDYTVQWDLTGTLELTQTQLGSKLHDINSEVILAIEYGPPFALQREIIQTYNFSGAQTSWTSPINEQNSAVLSINPDDKIRLVLYGSHDFGTVQTGEEANFQIDVIDPDFQTIYTTDSIFPESDHKVIGIYEAWNRILESISGTNGIFRSDYYGRVNTLPVSYPENGCGSFRVVTNGFNIRGFDEQVDEDSETYKPPIISLQTMFDSMNAIDNIGMDVSDNQIRIERKDFFYRDELIKNLGEVNPVSFSIMNELFYNECNIGYSKYFQAIRNGLDEFASQRQYSNKIKNNKAIYDLLSDIIASPYAIESARRDSIEYKPTQSSTFDDDIFIIQAIRTTFPGTSDPDLNAPSRVGDQFTPVIGEKPTSVTNARNGDSLYNIELSPVRNLLRHLNVMPETWDYISGKGNVRMKSVVDDYGCPGLFEGNELSERENDLSGDLLYYPIKMEFNYPTTIQEFISWKEKKYGYFEFTHCDRIYKGFILDLNFNATDNLCNFELIMTA